MAEEFICLSKMTLKIGGMYSGCQNQYAMFLLLKINMIHSVTLKVFSDRKQIVTANTL